MILQVLQFGISDFAIDLRQRFEAAHGKQRVPERNDDGDERDLRPEGAFEPAERIVG